MDDTEFEAWAPAQQRSVLHAAQRPGHAPPYPFSPCFAETVAGLPFVLTTRT
jgi:hypothetical protein